MFYLHSVPCFNEVMSLPCLKPPTAFHGCDMKCSLGLLSPSVTGSLLPSPSPRALGPAPPLWKQGPLPVMLSAAHAFPPAGGSLCHLLSSRLHIPQDSAHRGPLLTEAFPPTWSKLSLSLLRSLCHITPIISAIALDSRLTFSGLFSNVFIVSCLPILAQGLARGKHPINLCWLS